MWRHRARCKLCGLESPWQGDREVCRAQMAFHLKAAHQAGRPREGADYEVARERQCDSCLGPYLDHCTKCGGDYCELHAGDIDGLCGGCI